MNIPEIGSRWKREWPEFSPYKGVYNGYTVLFVTNLEHIHPNHPPQVVYTGDNKRVWSLPLDRWPGNLTPEEYNMKDLITPQFLVVVNSKKNPTYVLGSYDTMDIAKEAIKKVFGDNILESQYVDPSKPLMACSFSVYDITIKVEILNLK